MYLMGGGLEKVVLKVKCIIQKKFESSEHNQHWHKL